MIPEVPQPPKRETEDLVIDRYMRSVVKATEGGKVIGDVKYKFHRVGGLLVATVHRIYSPIYSVFAQDKRAGEDFRISGIEFDRELDTEGRNFPQVYTDFSGLPVEERVVDTLRERAVGAGVIDHTSDTEDTEEDEEYIRDSEIIGQSLHELPTPSLSEDFAEKLWKRVDEATAFADNMGREGLADAYSENLKKVAEGLEIVVFPGRWRKNKRLVRAEELFREGLGLTV